MLLESAQHGKVADIAMTMTPLVAALNSLWINRKFKTILRLAKDKLLDAPSRFLYLNSVIEVRTIGNARD